MMKKFDFVVGNPPYQENIENRGEQPPVYNKFYDSSIKIANYTILITPARFLFDAGKTPSIWNKKMLNSPHFKVLEYFPDATEIFPTTDIKGGVTITSWNSKVHHDPIITYIPNSKLQNILGKVRKTSTKYFDSIIFSNTSYKYSELFYSENSEFKDRVSGGSRRYLSSTCFEKFPEVFLNNKLNNREYVKVIGRKDSQRTTRYIKLSYLKTPQNFNYYKLVLPSSNGSGKFGEKISEPFISEPNVAFTETFVTFGNFANYEEANNSLQYIKGKFARALLGTKKVTQGNKNAKVWSNVPLQDFTTKSDIDWSKSISEIDQQLYNKYGLSQDEIDFIETNVQEMK